MSLCDIDRVILITMMHAAHGHGRPRYPRLAALNLSDKAIDRTLRGR